jgi:hypothetical protein
VKKCLFASVLGKKVAKRVAKKETKGLEIHYSRTHEYFFSRIVFPYATNIFMTPKIKFSQIGLAILEMDFLAIGWSKVGKK